MIGYHKKLGILGGMGPEATASLYLNIIKHCQKKFGAKYNSDFPHIIINSVPIPDGKMWNGFNKNLVIETLEENCKLLEKAKVDFIVIPCNSVHHFIGVMRNTVEIPVLSIVEETTRNIQKKNINNVSIFATHFTISTRIYEQYLSRNSINLIKPTIEQQEQVDRIIIKIESGRRSKSDKDALMNIIEGLQEKGAEGMILGCTEIPLLIKEKDISIPLFDTIDILAESAFGLLIKKGFR